MTDNISVTPGTGATIAAENIGGILIQRVKLSLGVVDTDNGDVSATQPLPANITMIGGSSLSLGQQLAAASIPVVLTAAQLTSLTAPVLGAGTALIGAVNVSQIGGTSLAFGQSTMSASIPVAIASNQSAIATISPVPAIDVSATITRPADTNTYAAGDVVYSTTSGSQAVATTVTIAKANDQPFTILNCTLKKSTNTTAHALFRVHLFNSQPTITNGDNGVLLSSIAGYVGYFDVNPQIGWFSDGAFGRAGPATSAVIIAKPVSGAQTLYVVLEARDAYVPGNAEVFTISFEVQ